MKQYHLSKRIPAILMRNGINLTETLRRADLPDDLFSRTEAKVDAQEYYRFVSALTHDLDNGEALVTLGTKNGLEHISPPVIAAMCSRNIIEAVGRMAYYADLYLPVKFDISNDGSGFRLGLKSVESEYDLPPVFGAIEILFMLNMFRKSTGHAIKPIKASLGIEPSDAIDEYLGIKADYRSDRTEIIFGFEDAHRPFISSNDELWEHIEPVLKLRLASLQEGCSFAERVQGALYELLPAGRSKVEDVAAAMRLSVRTIQRRLTDEGTRYQTVLRNARLILDEGLDSIPDIKPYDKAYLLAFSGRDCYRRAIGQNSQNI